MKSPEDAVALSEKEQDNFYVTAFLIETWLSELTLRAVAEYAEKKSASDRRLQTGEAARLFQEIFGPASKGKWPDVHQNLYRFAQYDDVQSIILMGALVPLSFEHPASALPELKPPVTAEKLQRMDEILRQRVQRLCDWLDAVVHWHTHQHYYLSPVSFDADSEKRELASLGVNQRCWAHLSEFSKTWWQWHHGEAAERFKDSPKWDTVGKAMAAGQTRRQAHPDLDNTIICLWPLVQRHNWSYRDLLNVLLMLRQNPNDFIFAREHELATHCNNVLGLRKTGEGKTTASGRPTGWEVALRLYGGSPA